MRPGLPSESWLSEPELKGSSSSISMHLPSPRGSHVTVSPLKNLFNRSERRMGTTLRISQYLLGRFTLLPWIHTLSPRHLRLTHHRHHSVLADLGTIRLILLHLVASLGRPYLLVQLLVHVLGLWSTRHLLAPDE